MDFVFFENNSSEYCVYKCTSPAMGPQHPGVRYPGIQCIMDWTGVKGSCLGGPKLTTKTWNPLLGKETEPVQEVDKFSLDIVVLTYMHRCGSGTNRLNVGWTHYFTGVLGHWPAQSEPKLYSFFVLLCYSLSLNTGQP